MTLLGHRSNNFKQRPSRAANASLREYNSRSRYIVCPLIIQPIFPKKLNLKSLSKINLKLQLTSLLTQFTLPIFPNRLYQIMIQIAGCARAGETSPSKQRRDVIFERLLGALMFNHLRARYMSLHRDIIFCFYSSFLNKITENFVKTPIP